MELLTLENWSHGQYIKDEMRAIISCGASYDNQLEYYITVLDENDDEVFQQKFNSLESAIAKPIFEDMFNSYIRV